MVDHGPWTQSNRKNEGKDGAKEGRQSVCRSRGRETKREGRWRMAFRWRKGTIRCAKIVRSSSLATDGVLRDKPRVAGTANHVR